MSDSNSFIVLLYHGVSESVHHGIENSSVKHLDAVEFDRQMSEVRNTRRVLSFREALTLREENALPAGSVVVTFDDGFENNYTTAFPILSKYDIPATFFVTTGFIGKPRVFWVDKIEYLLNETTSDAIRIGALDRTFSLPDEESRRTTLREIKKTLKTVPGLVDAVVTELEHEAGVEGKYDYEDYRTLSWDQIREMDRSGLCEFGSHSVDHHILSHLSRPEKIRQVGDSKATLERELGHAVDLFSYPEGQQNHYDPETIEIIKSAGYVASPTAIFGINTAEVSNFDLRRNMVGFTASFDACLEGSRGSS